MSNLLSSISNAANAMNVYQNAMQVVQNDVVNVNTPGYVKQTASFQSRPFDPKGTLAGGVSLGNTQSSRDQYAEQNVQQQQTALNMSSTIGSTLSTLQSSFDLQSTTGVAGSLNSLFTSFSQLSVSPNNAQSRASVLNAAASLASAFKVTANALATTAQTTQNNIVSTVSSLNQTVAGLQKINDAILKQPPGQTDPSLEAQIYVGLEQLSEYAGVSTLRAPDGTISVSLAGQKPLLIGTSQYQLHVLSTGTTDAILDDHGTDITSYVQGGQLGGLLNVQNVKLPSYQNQLDTMAKAIADTFNNQMAQGIDQNGAAGAPLFSYSPGSVAGSLALVATTTGDKIAAATSANPGGNDNAMTLSALQNNTSVSLGTYTFTQYFGNLSSGLGRDVSTAQNDQATQSQLVAQAQTLRTQSSGVSLNEEAARLEQYQQSYEATSKMISVVDNLLQTVLALIT